MKVKVKLDNNRLPDKYTRHAAEEFKQNDFPIVSFPFSIEDVPADTNGRDVIVPENASQNNSLHWIQGNNSSAGHIYNLGDQPISHKYMGPKPPSGVHDYTLTVYALDKKLNFKDGFWYNELIHNIDGHIIEQVKVDLPVEN